MSKICVALYSIFYTYCYYNFNPSGIFTEHFKSCIEHNSMKITYLRERMDSINADWKRKYNKKIPAKCCEHTRMVRTAKRTTVLGKLGSVFARASHEWLAASLPRRLCIPGWVVWATRLYDFQCLNLGFYPHLYIKVRTASSSVNASVDISLASLLIGIYLPVAFCVKLNWRLSIPLVMVNCSYDLFLCRLFKTSWITVQWAGLNRKRCV